MNRFFNKSLVLVALVGAITAFTTSKAQAATICTGCEYIDGAAGTGTYLGVYDPATFDDGTFQSHQPNGAAVNELWVFDIAPGDGMGSVSANFTASSSFAGFTGALYSAGAGTVCGAGAPSACGVVVLGALIQGDIDADASEVETGIVSLSAGRYVFQMQGTPNGRSGNGIYTGQVSTFVPEPAVLSLLGLGLFGAARRYRRKA
jgi:hypothetical protein